MSMNDSVLSTTDYSMFKIVVGNRHISPRPELEKSIKTVGVLSPILVTKDLKIIDGQHRLATCQKLGLAVPYIVREVSEAVVTDVNTSQKPWQNVDYLNRYVELGNENYIEIARLCKEYRLDAPTIIAIGQQGYASKFSNILRSAFRDGSFRFTEGMRENFTKRIALLSDIWQANGGQFEAIFKAQRSIVPLLALINHEKYDHGHFISRLNETNTFQVKRVTTVENGRIMLLQIYNYRLNGKNRISLSRTGNKGE